MSLRDYLVDDFYYGSLLELIEESIRDCDGELPERCIAKLTPAARAWVCGEIERCWCYSNPMGAVADDDWNPDFASSENERPDRAQ
jgi:hypothetical protein